MKVTLARVLKFLVPVTVLAIAAYALIFDPPASIPVIHPAQGPAVQAVYATGTVEPSVMVPIAAKSTAILLSLSADEGQKVVKGQILGQLEDEELQKTLVEMQAVADLAEKEYARRNALLQKNAVSQQSLDQAKSNLDAARARVDQVKANLEHMKLVAPEDGIIIRREGEIGELIPANQPVFWMSCCKGLRISAEVDEEDIASVAAGQDVVIRADAFPGRIFGGKVQSITPKGDPVSRSYRVRIGLDAETPMMIGMTAETNIVLREEKNALLLPPSAIRNGAVWRVEGEKVVHQPVEIGAQTPQAVEIRKGLGPKDRVVMNAETPLEPDQTIRVRLTGWKAP